MNAENIMFDQGQCNEGGLGGFLYYAPVDDFATIPAPATSEDATSLEEAGSITDPYVFKTGKCFKKLYCTLETGEVRFGMVGPRDSKSFEQIAEVSYPGNDKKFIGFLHTNANGRFIIIAKERNGRLRVVGTEDFPAHFDDAQGSSGKASADGRKTTMMFKSSACYPPPVYEGEVQLTPQV